MRFRLVAFLVLALISASAANADGVSVITGVQHLASGNPGTCAANNRPLRLLLGNGIISSMTGNCKGPIKPDTTFDGQCSYNGENLHFSGRVVVTTVFLHTEHVFPSFTCVYDTQLVPE